MKNLGLEKLFQDFYNVSGMEIALVSDKLNTLVSQKCPMENFCSVVHKSLKCLEKCKASDLQMANFANAEEGVAVQECFFGITQAVFAIRDEGVTVAYLLCSLGIDQNRCDIKTIIDKTVALDNSLDRETLEEALELIPKYSSEIMNSYLGMIKLIARHVESNAQTFADNPTVAELVRRFIDQNLSKKITLSDLSYHFHYSSVTITQSFKREYGKTIVEYTTNKRMERAKNLLLSTDKPLAEISLSCGFSDVEYFSRTFKKFFNLSPATWRKKQNT